MQNRGLTYIAQLQKLGYIFVYCNREAATKEKILVRDVINIRNDFKKRVKNLKCFHDQDNPKDYYRKNNVNLKKIIKHVKLILERLMKLLERI